MARTGSVDEICRSADEASAYVQTVPKAQGQSMLGVPFPKLDVVRIGVIGLGGRGYSLLGEMLAVEGTQIVAVSDPVEAHSAKGKERVEKAGKGSPAIEANWQKLCERKDLDLVYIASAWKDHVPQAVYAMECGKIAAVEVPAATTLADCWRLVDTSERTRKHCVMLENCCYGESELLALNLVRAGLLGTITHGEAAYIHDLRTILLAGRSEGLWRRFPHIERNGNLYPTHGLGPVAWYMDIHRSDRFTRLVSMSSQSAALDEYRDKTVPAEDPTRKEKYKCGDMNSSLIQTALGRTILLQHDVVTPRPYSRLNLVAGSKGAFADFPPRIFFDGDGHDWKPIDAVKAQWQHKLWKVCGEIAQKIGGHGGVDYIMNYRLIDRIRKGLPPDIDAYAAAAWSAPGPLSDISVAWGNIPLPFPDFTRGKWNQNDTPMPCDSETI
jgi:predicted dehydrogenase